MAELVSLNIEQGKHTDKNLPYLVEKSPDIVCLQEVPFEVFEYYKSELGYDGVFAPMCSQMHDHDLQGVATLSPYRVVEKEIFVYSNETDTLPVCIPNSDYRQYPLLRLTLNIDGTVWNVATTHGPVHYPAIEVSELQRKAYSVLLDKLASYTDLVLCGDLNVPRGYEMFSRFAKLFIDRIPEHYTTSIDPHIHRAGHLPYMVDALFTSKHYSASHVELVSGLSDHCGVVATLDKV